MRYTLLLILLISSLFSDKLSLVQMQKEKRVAYVIGNGDYDDSPIDQATANAQKMKTFLEKYDFDVTHAEDASKRDIIKGLRSFSSDMQPNGIALFYFSGHMIQVKDKNYLIPIEASIESDYHVLYEAIELDAILSKMYKNGNRLNIIIIDSAYKNPFGDRFRAKKSGIAKLKRRDNTDVILSVAPNRIVKAYPFTTKLLSVLSIKGTSNKEGFNNFQKRYKQSYFLESKKEFYFNLPKKLTNKEEKLWLTTLKLNSIPAYTNYLSKYPAGKHVKQANLDISALNKKAEDTIKKQLELETKAKEEEAAKAELEVLQKEQEAEAIKAAQERLSTEEKVNKETGTAAALVKEKPIIDETTPFIEPTMVLIKAGTYMMGSDVENKDASPEHQVVIERDFYIGKYEITNGEYKKFLRATKSKRMLPPNWTTDLQPVIGISWDDAVAYSLWLSKLTGKTYRLPTEQEWEYAARAESSTKYYWEDENLSTPEKAHDYAWIKSNSDNTTHEVGLKKPNAWGLHDITGNVWEWCANAYTDTYDEEPTKETLKVIRGGSWFSTPEEITLSHRASNENDFTSYIIGFRLLREK